MRRVYFIKPIGMVGPVKIGCSQSPDGRRKTLENWSPFPLEIIAEIEGGEALEYRFHAKFAAQHQRHEWFDWSPELQEVVDAVAAGTFDVESLPPAKRLKSGRPDFRRVHITPEWRYRRSVQARIQALSRRGMEFWPAHKQILPYLNSLGTYHPTVESIIHDLQTQYPSKYARRKAA